MATSDFGAWVRERRRERDLTQAALGKQAGCAAATIRKIESGARKPSRELAALLVQLLAGPTEDAATLIAAARGAVAPPTTPTPLTGLLGRQHALADIERLLASVRLLTLTGPGGIGKTRLAQAVVQSRPAGTALLIPLADLSSAAQVIPAIARACGPTEAESVAELVALLRGRTLLLVLDNCEHVLEAAPALAELLTALPDLAVLATSRAALRVRGETVFEVPPLERAAARTLFRERAQAALTTQHPAGGALDALLERLDGLPLAIELAAAGCRLFTARELLERLERLDLPAGPRDLPPRQQTLRATIQWSYDLLSEAARLLFIRCAIVAGGATFAALAEICAMPDLQPALDALLEQRLLTRHQGRDGQSRYGMLATVRAIAQDMLAHHADREWLATRHERWCVALVQQSASGLRGGGRLAWLDRLEDELPNLRAALGRALARGDAGTAAALAAPLWQFWHVRGYHHEGRLVLEQIVRLELPAVQQAHVQFAIGYLAWFQRDYDAAEAPLAQAARLADDPSLAAHAQMMYAATLLHHQHEPAQIAELADASVVQARAHADCWTLALVLFWRSDIASMMGDMAHAEQLARESWQQFQATGDTWNAGPLLMLGDIAFQRGALDEAAEHFGAAFQRYEELRDLWGAALCMGWLTVIGACAAPGASTMHSAESHLTRWVALGNRVGVARAHYLRGLVLLRQGASPVGALALAERAANALERLDIVALTLAARAEWCARQGLRPLALQLLMSAADLLAHHGRPLLPPYLQCYQQHIAATAPAAVSGPTPAATGMRTTAKTAAPSRSEEPLP